jgi:hypothetical protein
LVIVAIVLIIIVFQWRKVAQSKNSILMLEKEIELKKKCPWWKKTLNLKD